MKILSTQRLELNTTKTDAVHVVASWVDVDKTATTIYTPGTTSTIITSATTTTIVGPPASATVYRQVTDVSILHAGTLDHTITLIRDTSGTDYALWSASFAVGESFKYEDGAGWDRYTALGERMVSGRDGTDGAAGPPGVGTSGTTSIDFGSFPGNPMAEVAVTGQAAILASSKTEAWILPATTANHSADEHIVEPIRIVAGPATAGVGFTIYAFGESPAPPPNPADSLPKRNHGGTGGTGAQRGNRANMYRNPTPYGLFSVAWRWS